MVRHSILELKIDELHPFEQAPSSHLGIVIRPDFLATVSCLDKVLSDRSPLSHLFGKSLVHQTCCKYLEGPALVLCMGVSDGEMGPRTTIVPGVVTSHPAWKRLYQMVYGSNAQRTLFCSRATSCGLTCEWGYRVNEPTCPPAPRARMTSTLTSSMENSS